MTWMVVLAACELNQVPVVARQRITTPEDTPVSIVPDAHDPEASPLRVSFRAPGHGSVTLLDNTLSYAPDADYHGMDALEVTVSDGVRAATATHLITITPVNDAPVAIADRFAATEDTPLALDAAMLLANDRDIDGDALRITALGPPSTGTLATTDAGLRFTPAANLAGLSRFTYTISDGAVEATAAVTISVGGVNDPPIAGDDALATTEDTPITVPIAMLLANDSDADGQTLVLTEATAPSGGRVERISRFVTYTPTHGFHGTGRFDYTVFDGAAIGTGHVIVTVTPSSDPTVTATDARGGG